MAVKPLVFEANQIKLPFLITFKMLKNFTSESTTTEWLMASYHVLFYGFHSVSRDDSNN